MEICSQEDGSSVASSPISSPNISYLLKIKVLSWSKETGVPASAHIRVCNKSFNLHRSPLCRKSGYFKEREEHLSEELEIPPEFPGGADTFEKIMLFIYGCPTLLHPLNIAQLICAAEFLEITGNLCQRFHLYLNQVVLQNWDHTLLVLKNCQNLLPWSEDLLVVSRCIESLAFMACMEILDPERPREMPLAVLPQDFVNQPWEYSSAEKIINQDIWIKDLIDLPFEFFRRVIGSLTKQGMQQRYVTPLIFFYTNKCLTPEADHLHVLQGALDLLLLTIDDKASRFVPVGFYFTCLPHALKHHQTLLRLQDRIVSLLHTSHTENFIYPKARNGNVAFSQELLTMESMFSAYVSSASHLASSPSNMRVGRLWDIYLSRLPYDQDMETTRFVELIETVPMSFRENHDQLYLAVNAFLQVHKGISEEEKESICSYLDYQKLSQQVCIQVVQNDQMPLRSVVQSLFFQQLNTHQAFKDCSDSFRFTKSVSVVPSSICSNPRPLTDDEGGPRSRPLCFLMQKDATFDNYESMSFRIQNLEEQLTSLKESLQSHKILKKPNSNRKRSASQVTTGCIGSVWFKSQRKYTGKLLGVVRRVNLFGSRKSGESEK